MENLENLKLTISKLHESLAATDNVDPELESLLKTLDEDINQVLRKEEQPDADGSNLEERARYLAAEFAAQHPTLEPMLREIADMLGKMGI
jgi:iron-sulfur cluster repair protein YtfE (RIC family)